jgi:hypothetical protein
MDWSKLRPHRALFRRSKSPRNGSDKAPGTTSGSHLRTQSEPRSGSQPEPQENKPKPSKFEAAWLKGEQTLRDDPDKKSLLKKYNEILRVELDLDLDSLEPDDRHKKLIQVLEKKVEELDAKKITLLLGCTPGFEKSLKNIFQNLLGAQGSHLRGRERESTCLDCVRWRSGHIHRTAVYP